MYAFDYIQLSNVTCTNYFTTFLQTVNVENFYWFLYRDTTNIIFLLTNNYLSYYPSVK